MGKNAGISLNPEDFTEGGGLLDDAIVVIEGIEFAMFDYQGTVPGGAPSLKVPMKDEEGEEHLQYYSVGAASDWAPSPDGKKLIALGSATGLRSGSNAAIFLKSIVDSGFPAEDIGEDITVFDGMQVHVIRIPEPKRNIAKSDKQKEREKRFGPPTILVVDEIVAMPGEKKKPVGAPGGKKAAKKAAGEAKPKAEATDVEDKTVETVTNILLEKGGEVNKKLLPQAVFVALKNDADRSAVAKLAFEDDFLGADGRPWEYDAESGVVSMG